MDVGVGCRHPPPASFVEMDTTSRIGKTPKVDVTLLKHGIEADKHWIGPGVCCRHLAYLPTQTARRASLKRK
jgi:hypothetical protein